MAVTSSLITKQGNNMRNFLNNIITKVSGNEFKLLHVIYEDVNSSMNECVLTNEQLAKSIGESESTVKRCISKLEESGILTRQIDKAIKTATGIKHESNPRTINLTGLKKIKKISNWKEDEKFASFYNRYRDSAKKVGSLIGANQKTAYKLYIKIKDKEELINNTNEYCRQMISTNTFIKGITSWLNNTSQHWINDDYVARPVVKVVDYKEKRVLEAQKHYKQYIKLVDLNTREEKAELYNRILKQHNQGTPYVIEEEIIKLINN
jgi:predicted transcriptional regulator